ncbi:hypothetical protein M422DRAFT_31190 [Sphaerobolus stellatus SS14]|uniref:Uncharacterized protein n=1 Tax=Sphaerobolus stellatus (strain SS14) TaxID=990650 RepID=A0A0C9V7C7_SPHS4|nr:hypothetical protein M422DRAFT_31190 [Sphaerobolus stellatus SS14]
MNQPSFIIIYYVHLIQDKLCNDYATPPPERAEAALVSTMTIAARVDGLILAACSASMVQSGRV